MLRRNELVNAVKEILWENCANDDTRNFEIEAAATKAVDRVLALIQKELDDNFSRP